MVEGQREPAALRPPTILVVEDDILIADLMRATLEDAGMQVVTVDRGDQAVLTLHGAAFDAVVLDLMLPGRSGLRILDDLKTHPQLRTIPVVVVSAVSGLVPPQMRRQVVVVLSKPFDVDLLVKAVRRAISPPRRRSAARTARPAEATSPSPDGRAS